MPNAVPTLAPTRPSRMQEEYIESLVRPGQPAYVDTVPGQDDDDDEPMIIAQLAAETPQPAAAAAAATGQQADVMPNPFITPLEKCQAPWPLKKIGDKRASKQVLE